MLLRDEDEDPKKHGGLSKKTHTEVRQVKDCSSAHAHAGASDFGFQLADKIPFEGFDLSLGKNGRMDAFVEVTSTSCSFSNNT